MSSIDVEATQGYFERRQFGLAGAGMAFFIRPAPHHHHLPQHAPAQRLSLATRQPARGASIHGAHRRRLPLPAAETGAVVGALVSAAYSAHALTVLLSSQLIPRRLQATTANLSSLRRRRVQKGSLG